MIEIIANSDLFKGIDREILKNILEKYAIKKTYNKGEYIFMEGEKPKYMYLLISGEVTVFSDDQYGKRELLKSFSEPGTLFAEVYLYLNIDGFDLSCVAEEDTELISLNKEFFSQMYNLENQVGQTIAENYLHILSEKLYFFNRKIRMMSGFTLRQKLSRYILENRVDDKNSELNQTREEIADFLGVTRPSVSRELAKMKDDGLIEYNRSSIKILDLEALKNNY